MSNHHDDATGARRETPESPDAQSLSAAREAVREKAQQVKTRQARARVARISAIAVVLVAVIAAVAVVVTMTVSRDVSKPKPQPAVIDGDGIKVTPESAAFFSTLLRDGSADTATPTATTTAAAATTEAAPRPTTAAKPVEVQVYVDYFSEGAGAFQATNAEQLGALVEAGAINLTYHPVAMLTANSNGTKYSLRAAGAAACVATIAPAGFLAYNTSLLQAQPKPESDGYSDAELGDMAAPVVGKSDAQKIRSCITDGTYLSWVKGATERALKNKLPGTGEALKATPTILVDGTPYVGKLTDRAEFMQSIMDAESNAYYQSATPSAPPTGSTLTPTATPTPAS